MLALIFTTSRGNLLPQLSQQAEPERSVILKNEDKTPNVVLKEKQQQNQGQRARFLQQLAAHPYEHAYIHVQSAVLCSDAERHGSVGAHPEGHKNDPRDGIPAL